MKNLIYTFLALLFIQACMAPRHFRANYRDANALMHQQDSLQQKPFLKAHLKNGDVCILKDTWKVDTVRNIVSGNGSRYDFNRHLVEKGELTVVIDSVAIFETNKILENTEDGRITAVSIITMMDLTLGVICLSNPKACFGSCPTFYIHENDLFHYADAEGFSNAISPALEYADIDALYHAWPASDTFSLTMKNEALETHCVEDVQLLAVPVQPGEKVYQSPDNRFYRCDRLYPLSKATAAEGNITALLSAADLSERFSPSDPQNLRSKEEVFLEFDAEDKQGQLGLVLDFRQTLMTTYFIYNAIGYMGDEVGDVFARLETSPRLKTGLNGIKKELGSIDVYQWDEQRGEWILQNSLYETGPIAVNRQFVPLRASQQNSERIRLKIVQNKGLWRLDYAALARIVQQEQPLKIAPSTVLNKGRVDASALHSLRTEGKYLVSMPGSAYKLQFALPQGAPHYELFLQSKGYYLEWMRAHWLKDKNLRKLRQMLVRPGKYLRDEALAYKEYEQYMEQEFWNSRIDTKNFSGYEK
ncbi:MAG: hypothetical protein JNM22_03790 [Saprospiraceae bacterium]|nr:hypothetical protein [Saprospiraceae bacterium]